MGSLFGVTWYRLRATFKRRWTGYVSVVALIALAGGVSMAALAGARRTESSFATYFSSTNPSTVQLFTSYVIPQLQDNSGFRPQLNDEIAHLPHVARATTTVIFDGNIDLDAVTGVHPHAAPGESPPTIVGSADGGLTSMDRVSLIAGRMFAPGRADEAVMNVQAAEEMGVHIGSVVTFPVYTDAQDLESNPGKPFMVRSVRLVGEIVASRDVVESDADALGAATVVISPALTGLLEARCATGTETQLQVVGGVANVPSVLDAAYRLDPVAQHFPEMLTSAFVPAAEHAISPEAVALGVFGAVAGITALLIAGLMLARLVRSRASEVATLRAIGASPSMLLGDELLGVCGAVVVGALLAFVVSVGLSPLMPLGPVRPIYPERGLSFDWTVLGFGVLSLLVVLGALAVTLGAREARQAAGRRSTAQARGESRWVKSSMQGLPISMTTGLRFALESGRGRNAAPVRSAILGSVLAVVVLVATLTFGASLDSLVSHPALFGWNWNYAILSAFAGQEDLPSADTAKLLDADHAVQAWSGVNFTNAALDGERLAMLTEAPNSAVAPPILSGHGLQAANEVVLGQTTLTDLGKRVGQTVSFDNGIEPRKTLLIVGTATMPALVNSGGGMGMGALVATSDFPAKLLNGQGNAIPGPNAVLVRIRASVSPSVAYHSLDEIESTISSLPGDQGSAGGVVGVLRPIEIVNFKAMDATPAILAGGLALAAVIALGLAIAASVRRRRRQLALLKTLGFTQRQLASAIAWQATAAAMIGAVVGIPFGIVIGSQLWVLFARSISAVPSTTIPVLSIVLVGLGAVIFANAVAALPGRSAAKTPTALVLRAE